MSTRAVLARWWRLDARLGPVLVDVNDLKAGDHALATGESAGRKMFFLFRVRSDGGVDLESLASGVLGDTKVSR